MTSNWPQSYDTFYDPTSTTRMNDPTFNHATMHALTNDALNNIEHFLGATPNYNVVTVGPSGIPFAGNPPPQDGQILTYHATPSSVGWTTQPPGIIPYTKTGPLLVSSGTIRFPVFETVKVVGALAMLNTSPTGAAVILDVLKNGASIYTNTNNRPTIADGGNTSQIPIPQPDINTAVLGDYFQVNILQVGSTTPGADLSIVIVYT